MDLLADLDPSERESSESQSEEGGSRMTLVVKNRSLAVRAHTLAATIIVSSNDTELDYKEIKNRLVNLLKYSFSHSGRIACADTSRRCWVL
jgi:hypothetical protein